MIRPLPWLCTMAAFGISVLRGGGPTDELVARALAAEERLDSKLALSLFLEADRIKPDDPIIVQKIARQYSDLVVDQPSVAEKKRHAEIALGYAERSVKLDPKNPVNVLSLAVCNGTLGVYSGNKEKIRYSRKVKEEAERALALDPNYAWAHHLLGRWNYEVATLGPASRFFVKLLYGGLPAASTRKAIEDLTRAVELEPRQLEHVLELGFAYAADGQNQKARVQFERGLAMPGREKHSESAKTRAREALSKLER